MIEVLFIASAFMTVVLIAILILGVHIKSMTDQRHDENKKRLSEMSEQISDLKNIVQRDVAEILNRTRDIFKID